MSSVILAVGVDPALLDQFKGSIKVGLQGRSDGGFEYKVEGVATCDKAIEFLARQPAVDVVFVADDKGLDAETLLAGIEKLANALVRNPGKPFVVLDATVEYAQYVFDEADVNTEFFDIVTALQARHDSLTGNLVKSD